MGLYGPHAMSDNPTVATGYVTVRDMRLNEWQEKVTVTERDIEDGWTPEDAARSIAMSQAGGDAVDVVGVELG
jgi:hypothetical protein